MERFREWSRERFKEWFGNGSEKGLGKGLGNGSGNGSATGRNLTFGMGCWGVNQILERKVPLVCVSLSHSYLFIDIH